MSKLFSLPFLLTMELLLFSHLTMASEELAIIMAKNTSVGQISKAQLERIYQRKSLLNAQGERWIPLNLTMQNPLRISFSQYLFKKRPEEMESFWNIQYFKGIAPPYVVSSEEAMLRFVASTPGAIGYVHRCHLDDRVRVLMIFKLPLPTDTVLNHCE